MALHLRFQLQSGPHAIPLQRVHYLAGYATLAGEPDEYFAGWLLLHGQYVPVFDLNRVVCDEPTPEVFGSRIVVIKTPDGAPVRHLGLLAAGATDTVPADHPETPLFDLDGYLAMLYTLVPESPEGPR